LPGILSPVKVDGRWLLDGGMTNPVPVSACRAMGANIIIAVNPQRQCARVASPGRREDRERFRRQPGYPRQAVRYHSNGISRSLKTIAPGFLGSKTGAPSYIEVLSNSIDIMTSQILRSRLAGEPPHVMINPHLSHMPVLEFSRAEEAIEEGRQSAKKVMPLSASICRSNRMELAKGARSPQRQGAPRLLRHQTFLALASVSPRSGIVLNIVSFTQCIARKCRSTP
jgi:NTE family protein